MPDHPYGWLSLAPPLATVVLAIVTKRATASLIAGLFVGAMILTGGDLVQSTLDTLERHLWTTFIEPFKLRVLGFTLLMGAMIGVINAAGGMQGLVRLITPLAKTRRRGQLVTWFTGLLVFFDDYTNTLILGATMRSTCDRLRISREKLAYLVDSTAAPVAGLALLSTWVAVEITFIQDGLNAADPQLVGDTTAVGIFIGCLPYRFYMIQALLFVPVLALLGRDFGPMLHAERRALQSMTPPLDENAAASPNKASHWTNAATPLLVTLATVLILILTTGRAACLAAEPTVELNLREVFGAADSAVALFYGSLLGVIVAGALAVYRRLLTTSEACDAAFAGARAVFPALAVLTCASALSNMTGNGGQVVTAESGYALAGERLYTGDFLQSLLPMADDGKTVSTAFVLSLPTIVFLLASAVSFSTGTSFGTMGILLPVVAPIAMVSLGPNAALPESLSVTPEPLLLATFGAVLSGAIFGDHCSPISDTTVLSSQSSGCDHVAHVVTQLPYALTVAVVCLLLGSAPLAFGVSVWVLLPIQTVALVVIARFVGRQVEQGSVDGSLEHPVS